MGGFFGVASRDDCVADLFYGTDYHSHLGTSRGGIVVRNRDGFRRNIHDITNTPFRTKFEDDIPKYRGASGIGVISDFEDQPLLIEDLPARTPAARRQVTACSLLDPHPKLRPATMPSPGCTLAANDGSRSSKAWCAISASSCRVYVYFPGKMTSVLTSSP